MNDEHGVLEDVAGMPWASADASTELIRKATPCGFAGLSESEIGKFLRDTVSRRRQNYC
jgi:hypothetical protein